MISHTTISRIALVAHDHKKQEMVQWVAKHKERLARSSLIASGTTGRLIQEATGLVVERLQSGPLGGDQQIGARIAQDEIDMLVFFWDPLAPMPHDPDIKALLRLATLWNIPMACNLTTANFLLSSPLVNGYDRLKPDFERYQNRSLAGSGL